MWPLRGALKTRLSLLLEPLLSGAMDGEELEGDEDWRYGPLGRAGVLKAEEAPRVATEPLRSSEVRPRTIWAYWAQGHEEMPAAWIAF